MDELGHLKLTVIRKILQTDSVTLLKTIDEMLNLIPKAGANRQLNPVEKLDKDINQWDIHDVQASLDQIFGGQ